MYVQRAFFDASHLAAHPDGKGLVWMGGDVATSIELAEVGLSVKQSVCQYQGLTKSYKRECIDYWM